MKPIILISTLSLSLALINCTPPKKEIPPATPPIIVPNYTIPTSYNFNNASISTPTNCIAMLGELVNYIRTTHTSTLIPQPTLSAQKLKDLFSNASNQFTNTALNSSGINLKEKTSNSLGLINEIELSYDDAEKASVFAALTPTVQSAKDGVAGKLLSTTRSILVDKNGLEYKELTEKGLMGSILYYQATTILTKINTYDNTTIESGTTAQEKAWDDAFGYFGVPTDFPTNITGLKNWGSYCNSVDGAIGSNKMMMDAFLKGRAAITNKDNATRDAQALILLNTWERFAAAKCLAYMKGAKTNFSKDADRHHNLSETVGFINALAYNPSKKITEAQLIQLRSYFGTNLYLVDVNKLDNAISTLAGIFNLDASKL